MVERNRAAEFLERLDTDADLRYAVRKAHEHVLDVARKHGFDLTHDQLTEELMKKWGPPKHREDNPEAFCCMFSEPPSY